MKKSMFIFGSVEALAGILLWGLADMIKNIMPLLGRIAFQAAMKGSYSPRDYHLDITLPTILAASLIAVGTLQIFLSLKQEK